MCMEKSWDSPLSVIIYMFIFPSFFKMREKGNQVVCRIHKYVKLTHIWEIKALSPIGERTSCKKALIKADMDSCAQRTGTAKSNGLSSKKIPLLDRFCRGSQTEVTFGKSYCTMFKTCRS